MHGRKSRSIKVKGKRGASRIQSPRINSQNAHKVSKKTFSLRLAKEFAQELSYGYSSMLADNSHNQHAATNGGHAGYVAESLGTKTKSMIRNTLKFVWETIKIKL